ncbi:uncharacterized protein LOC105229283 isoform X1 [Bactrocera dorsalis]|uniref:Uncharacterized protein LOC105229283 isoform X1 n=2 Tax=Bactrocera dorsalis TaxID=27457 RepID=A0A6I9VUD3_BACDO|nr:uncharacterized protein LOC105229283 isoform X1 [Bactrocera dorsalis]
MSLTPGKEDNINLIKNLTPVRFSDNTRGKSCMQDSNVQTCKDRLDIIISQEKSNFSKWQLAQKRGLAICTSIESIKTRALESRESSRNLKEKEEILYPKDLTQHIEKLNIILTIFKDITKHAEESLRQLIKLGKLVGNMDKIFYQSWPMSQYINFFDQLCSSYNKENKIKQRVACELPHCMNRSDLIRFTTAWEYPQYIDEWTSLMFAFLEEENKNKT